MALINHERNPISGGSALNCPGWHRAREQVRERRVGVITLQTKTRHIHVTKNSTVIISIVCYRRIYLLTILAPALSLL